jgi:hypothetical protein
MKNVFRYFIRKNFEDIGDELSNEDIDEIGIEFHKYLDEKLSDEQKQKILQSQQRGHIDIFLMKMADVTAIF